MAEAVGRWSEERAAKVRACYCSPLGAKVVFFFFPSSGTFDFALANELAELNLTLCNTFNVGTIETHQIPWADADRFLNLEASRRVYGEPLHPPQPMET